MELFWSAKSVCLPFGRIFVARNYENYKRRQWLVVLSELIYGRLYAGVVCHASTYCICRNEEERRKILCCEWKAWTVCFCLHCCLCCHERVPFMIHILKRMNIFKNEKEKRWNKLCILFHLPASDLQAASEWNKFVFCMPSCPHITHPAHTPHSDENKCETWISLHSNRTRLRNPRMLLMTSRAFQHFATIRLPH